MLSAQRDVLAAKRFFVKMMKAEHPRLSCSINLDKECRPPLNTAQTVKALARDCKLRRVKYLNNVIEQDHRFIKKKVRA